MTKNTLSVPGYIQIPTVFLIFLSKGFVTMKLYEWFMLSAMPELPHFTMWQFVGFLFFFVPFTGGVSSYQFLEEDLKVENHEVKRWLTALLNPWFLLLLAYTFKNIWL